MKGAVRPLAHLAIGMTALVPLLVAGLVLDPRVVTGVPVWLKPLKFTVSVAIYAGTLALIVRHLAAWLALSVAGLAAATAATRRPWAGSGRVLAGGPW
jgi:hypothetical protein